MRVNKVIMTNFRKYKFKEVEFTDGFNIIVGKNGSGKTTVVDAILYALFGVEALPYKSDSIRFRGAKEEAEVYISLTVNAQELEIVRTESTAELAFGSDEVKGLTPVTNYILNLLKIDKNIFKTISCIYQDEVDNFTKLTPSKRKKLIEKIQGVEQVKKAVEMLTEENRELKSEVKVYQNVVDSTVINEPPANPGIDIEIVKASLEECKKKLYSTDIDKVKRYRLALQDMKAEPVEVDRDLKQTLLLEEMELKNKLSKVEAYEKVLDRLKELADVPSIDFLEADLKAIDKNNEILRKFSLEELESKPKKPRISDKEKELYEKHAGIKAPAVSCPSCKAELVKKCSSCGLDFAKLETVQAKMRQLELYEACKEFNFSVNADNIRETQKLVYEKEELIKKASEYKVDMNEDDILIRLKEIEKELKVIDEQLTKADEYKRYVEMKKYIDEHLSEEEYISLLERKKLLEEQIIEYNKYVNALSVYETKKAELDKNKKLLLQAEKKQKLVNNTLKMMNKFSAHLNSVIVPTVEKEANKVFVNVTNGKYKSFTLDNNFNIKIDDIPLEGNFSKGETVLANLSLRLGISNLIKHTQGALLDCLVMDEVSSSFDQERKERAMEAISNLKNNYKQVILITHDTLEMSYADNLINLGE